MLIVKLKDKEQAKRAINEGYRLILIAFYTQSDEKHYCIVSISPAYVPTNNLFNSVFYKDIVETIVHRILVSTDRLFRVNLIAKEIWAISIGCLTRINNEPRKINRSSIFARTRNRSRIWCYCVKNTTMVMRGEERSFYRSRENPVRLLTMSCGSPSPSDPPLNSAN